MATTTYRDIFWLFIQLLNNNINLVSTALEANVSQILFMLDAINDDIEWVATTTDNNITKLIIQLDAVTNDINHWLLLWRLMYPRYLYSLMHLMMT